MFAKSVPWWELIVRSGVVYVFLLILLRLTGKGQVGQLSPFDLVLLLVLSNAVQNSMNAGDNSLIGGLLSAAMLVAINALVGYISFRNKKLEALIEGRPEVIIHNGTLFDLAVLETTGKISVIPRAHKTNAILQTTQSLEPQGLPHKSLRRRKAQGIQ